MKNKKILAITCAILGYSLIGLAQDGEALFNDNCTACHTIGSGKLVGPDLKGVHEKRSEQWLLSFIKSSQSFIASGDEDAKAIFDEFNGVAMPDQPFSDEEIKSIIAYISTKGPADMIASTDGEKEAEEVEEEDAEPAFTTKDATDEDIKKGMNLFSGSLAFENKAVACISCHNVSNDKLIGGGRLAKDLTDVHGRMGDLGVSGILSSPPFPAMKQAYKDRPLTDEEIYALVSFFNYSSEQGVYQIPRTWDWVLVWGGGGFMFCFIAWLSIVFFNRKTKSTKHDILARQGYYNQTK